MTPPDPNLAAGNPPDPTANGAGSQGNQPGDLQAKFDAAQAQITTLTTQAAEAESWKNRFTGLQGTYQREQAKWTNDSGRISEFEKQIAALSDERTTLQTQIAELTPYKAEVGTLKAQQERQKIIVGEFPDLFPFEVDGLLPDGTGDELRRKLTAMRTRLEASNSGALDKRLSGSVPPPPGGAPPSGPQELLKASLAAFKKGDMAEYQRLQTEYYQSLQTK